LDTNARSEGTTAKAGVGRMSALGEPPMVEMT
jgi:hypothetical protein